MTKISKYLAAIGLVAATGAYADEKICTVKGMHCEACIEMVKDRVCNDSFEVCDLTLKGKVGTLRLKTKESSSVIDAKELSKAMADTNYSVSSCAEKKGKG